MGTEGRGDAEQNRIGLGKAGGVAGGFEAFGGGEIGEDAVAEVVEVRRAVLEVVDLGGIDVESEDREAGLVDGIDQGQANVAQPDDGDGGGAGLQSLAQICGGGTLSGGGRGWRGRRCGDS